MPAKKPDWLKHLPGVVLLIVALVTIGGTAYVATGRIFYDRLAALNRHAG